MSRPRLSPPQAQASPPHKLLELLGAININVSLGPLYSVLELNSFPSGCMYQQAALLQSRLDADTLNGVANSMLVLLSRTYFNINDTAKMPLAEEVYKKAVDAGVDTVIMLGCLTGNYAGVTHQPPQVQDRAPNILCKNEAHCCHVRRLHRPRQPLSRSYQQASSTPTLTRKLRARFFVQRRGRLSSLCCQTPPTMCP